MGDFSRDPDTRLQLSVANHYVGVRMQQGVPILDTDWNELEDLRRHELAALFQNYMGNGVPDGNDGFHIVGLAAGGIGNIVLQAAPVASGITSIQIDFIQSTGASLLGLLPVMSSASRGGTNPAQLSGNQVGPFALSDGLTLAIQSNGEAVEVVTFNAADFADIAQATAAEVIAVLNANLTHTNASIGTGNDFIIRGGDGTVEGAGRIIVHGAEAVNEMDLTYAAQPLYENAALATAWGVPELMPLTTPAADRTDLVYIDIWDREVNSVEDDNIILQPVGIEASTRMRREWAVRVAEGTDTLEDIVRIDGHRYETLALLRRVNAEDGIAETAVIDERTRNLNVARYLKTPILLERGTDLVDAERYADVMDTFRNIFMTRLELLAFPFLFGAPNSIIIYFTLHELAQQAGFASVQASAGNFNNHDGLDFLGRFYDMQSDFLRVVEDNGSGSPESVAFIQDYRDRLDGNAGLAIDGLEPALDAGDLLLAVNAQEEINAWLAAPINILPEGDITIVLVSVVPATNIAPGTPFNIAYRIESNMTSPQVQEQIDLTIDTVLPSTWQIDLNPTEIVIDAAGGSEIVNVTVIPQGGTATTEFVLTATANRNPLITQTQTSDPFELNQPPPTDQFLQWREPELDGAERLALTSIDRNIGSVDFQIELVNTSTTETQVFEVTHFITEPAGEEGQWLPNGTGPNTSPTNVIAPDSTAVQPLSFILPQTAAIGGEGTLTVTATLIEEGGIAVINGKSRTLEIPIIVIS